MDWVSTVHDLPDSVDVIVNLAGEGIADARWSAARRKLLIESRVTLTQDLAKVANQKQVAQVISASAVGFYGSASEVDENAAQGSGFAAELCADWEGSAAQFNAPTAIIRLGVVLGPGGSSIEHYSHFLWDWVGLLAQGTRVLAGSTETMRFA